MSKKDLVSLVGIVKECLPGARFLVELQESQHKVMAYASGKIRKNHIRIIEGDKVTVEMSAQDIANVRIIFREK